MSEFYNMPDLLRYKRLIEITRDLASTLELNTVLHRIIHFAKDLCDGQSASILLYDSGRQHLDFMAATEHDAEVKLRGIEVPTESIAGWVALNKKPLVVDDVHTDVRYFETVEKELQFPTRSIIAIPMLTKDTLIGVLEVINKRSGPITPADQDILMILGAVGAVAIENTRLFQQADMISELVHDIRTPLSSISTIAYLLQLPQTTEDQKLSYAKTVQQEATRLNEMATQFLDLSKLESGRAQINSTLFDLREILTECVEFMRIKASEARITLIYEAPQEELGIFADRDKLKQVILNLLSNAVKYNRPGGMVVVQSWAEDQHISFSIEDNGIGMSQECMVHIFEKFYRGCSSEQIQGTGLGLSICKGIIEKQGGEILVKSKENIGTTFTVRLKRKPE